jgi:hypothetical protein
VTSAFEPSFDWSFVATGCFDDEDENRLMGFGTEGKDTEKVDVDADDDADDDGGFCAAAGSAAFWSASPSDAGTSASEALLLLLPPEDPNTDEKGFGTEIEGTETEGMDTDGK